MTILNRHLLRMGCSPDNLIFVMWRCRIGTEFCNKQVHVLGKLGPEQIERLLQQECVARIGCHANGMIYVVPVTYWYDGTSAVCHSAEGQKIHMMRANPNVCMQVDRMMDMNNWESVVAQGSYEELSDEEAAEATGNFSRWLKSRKPSVTADPTHPDHPRTGTGSKRITFRIRLSERSGRFEKG